MLWHGKQALTRAGLGAAHKSLEALRGMYDRGRLFVLIGPRPEAIHGRRGGVKLMSCKSAVLTLGETFDGAVPSALPIRHVLEKV